MLNGNFRYLMIATLAVLLMITGCRSNYVEIELRPDGAQMNRTAWLRVDEAELRRISALYETDVSPETLATIEEKKSAYVSFEGLFEGDMPNDIGGSGFYLYTECDLGSSAIYSETVRGQQDMVAMWERQSLAVNRIMDVTILWLEWQVGDEPGFVDLRRVVDTDIRHDVLNFHMYSSTFSAVGKATSTSEENPEDKLFEDVLVRMVHYLVERGYLTAGQILDATGEMILAQDEGIVFATLVTRAIANKMGVAPDDDLPRPLQALYNRLEELEDQTDVWLQESQPLRNLVASWNEGLDEDELYLLEDAEFYEQLFEVGISWDLNFFWGSNDRLEATLVTGVEPYLGNGSWSSDGYVTWDQSLASSAINDGDLPNLLYAAWSVPNRQAQQDAFDWVAVRDDHLLEYCQWRNKLSRKHAREWRRFIGSIEKGTILQMIEQLHAFRFSDEVEREIPEGGSKIQSRRAWPVISAIIRGLGKVSEEKASEKAFDGFG